MNNHPLIDVRPEDAETYERDGAVCIRQVCDQDWVEKLKAEAIRFHEDPLAAGLIPGAGNKHMCRVSDVFLQYIFESAVAEVTAKVLRSKTLRFFYDEIFVKEAGKSSATYWHTDSGGWPVSGDMTPSVWMPLTPVKKAYCLEVLAGSHRDKTNYWNTTRNSRHMTRPSTRPLFPNFEERRDDPSLTFLSWDMEPGDLLVVHPRAFHYSASTPTDTMRIAVSTRWFGEDIRWSPRPDCINHAGLSYDEMVQDQPPAGDLFPLLWSETETLDDSSRFPRGFATQWSKNKDSYSDDKLVFGNLVRDVNYQDRLTVQSTRQP